MSTWKKLLLIICAICLPLSVMAFSGEITDHYGPRGVHPVTGKPAYHYGVDIGGHDIGTPYPSLTSGTVTTEDYQISDDGSGWGNYIEVQRDDGSGDILRYAHNSGFAVPVGTHVNEGDIIAYVGDTGGVTAPHIHVEYLTGGTEHVDPTSFVASKWNLTEGGEHVSGTDFIKAVYNRVTKKAEELLPAVDLDWSTYFQPSKVISTVGYSFLEECVKAFYRLQDVLVELFLLIIAIDLLVFLGMAIIKKHPADFPGLFERLFRYLFYMMIIKSWAWICTDVMIPSFEYIGSAFSGSTISANSFLAFDTLFTSLGSIVGNYTHMHISAMKITEFVKMLVPFILQNIIIWVILGFAMLISVFVMYKVCMFYMVCVFGIIGVPFHMIPFFRPYSENVISSVLTMLIELIVIAFFFGLMLNYFSQMEPIKSQDLASLIAFTAIFIMYCLTIPRESQAAAKYFNHLLN